MYIRPQSNIVPSGPPVKIKVSDIFSNTVRGTRKAHTDHPPFNTRELKSVIPSFNYLGQITPSLVMFPHP